MHRHLKHFGYGMGDNGTDITRLEDLAPEFKPYIGKNFYRCSKPSDCRPLRAWFRHKGSCGCRSVGQICARLEPQMSRPHAPSPFERGRSLRPLDGLRFAYMFARRSPLVILACNSQNYHG